MKPPSECDVVVLGAGAGGLSTAIVAKTFGLNVVVLEKEPLIGGSTALSGGVLWIPGNGLFPTLPGAQQDTREAALAYIRREAGLFFDEPAVEAFLDNGPKMVAFFEERTALKFIPTLYPDYHPDLEGGADIGRSIMAAPFDTRGLGADLKRLRPPLRTITFMGMMFNSSNADLKHFFNVTKSLKSAVYVAKRLLNHAKEIALYGRGVNVTAGNALAARLAKSAFDLGIGIHTAAAVRSLLVDAGQVTGVILADGSKIIARKGVVLASGGFSHDLTRLGQAYPHVRRGGVHLSPTAPGNTGDGAALAESVGAAVPIRYPQAAAWMPVSEVKFRDGSKGVFPHLLDRYKPGVIGVLKNGRRFTNESASYHDVGAALIEACKDFSETAMWLICDQSTIGKYGLGYAKPSPLPLGPLIKNGYLSRGATIAALAKTAGLDAAGLEATVKEYNLTAINGVDAQFGRGTTLFNRYLADPQQTPNPCVAAIGAGPYYAVKLLMGDLGTFDGLRTGVSGQVLDSEDNVIPGLFAVGNDRSSIMGGSYPAAGITLGPILTFGFITGRYLAGVA